MELAIMNTIYIFLVPQRVIDWKFTTRVTPYILIVLKKRFMWENDKLWILGGNWEKNIRCFSRNSAMKWIPISDHLKEVVNIFTDWNLIPGKQISKWIEDILFVTGFTASIIIRKMRSAQILKSDTILSVLKEKILMRPSIPELRDLLLRLPLFVKPKQLRLYLVSFSATVENHLVRILMVVSVVINIGFAHIRPFNVVFTAWSYMISVENHLVGKVIVGFVLNLHSDRSI